MSMQLPLASFSDFIKLRKQFITIQDDRSYERVTVQLHTRGIINRDVILGSQVKTKKQQVIRAYDLLVAEIDAKLGGFGIVPPELDGAIVSSHYFTYEIDTTIIDLDYLAYYLRLGRPTEDIQQYVTGSTNYAAIRDYHFPKLHIPLPNLQEQHRIVAILDAFTSRIDEAMDLLKVAMQEVKDIFIISIDTFSDDLPANQCKLLTLEQATTYIQRGVSPNYDSNGDALVVNQKCVRPEGLILDYARPLANEQASKLAEERFLRVGDVLLNSTGEGTLGRSTVVETMAVQAVVDSHVTIIRPDQSVVLPNWIDYFLKSSKGRQQIQAKKTGSTKQTELSRASVLGLQLIVPAVKVQSKIVSDIDKGAAIGSSFIRQLEGMIERYKLLLSQLLADTFVGGTIAFLPAKTLEESFRLKARKQEYQEKVLSTRRREAEIKEEQNLMEKIEMKEAFDLTRLAWQYLNDVGMIDAAELWKLAKSAGLDIDTFYAYLKVESAAQHMKDIREDHTVYLELSNEVKAAMD